MAKLKSLRSSIGNFGRVSAGGIVEVDDTEAKKLLETKRFVTATEKDIKAAQKRLKDFLAGNPAAAEAQAKADAAAEAQAKADAAAEAQAKADAEAKAAETGAAQGGTK